MFLLDTDILTLFFQGRDKVAQNIATASEKVATTIVNYIESLRGRFDSVFKAADGTQLLKAMNWLSAVQEALDEIEVVIIDQAACDEFDKILKNKKLKKLRRGDLLIASIALANKATLVTRNTKDFEQVPQLQYENWAD